jgi:hypothetical protein
MEADGYMNTVLALRNGSFWSSRDWCPSGIPFVDEGNSGGGLSEEGRNP